ncbi:Uncharacterized conserved protein [Rhizobium sp. RU35A]|uniref:GFA family protein n=1 Tax=Rhizobium sp. RU35A TaxID=1907414 RepID=UPI0009566BF0|nr:GFA family protein [Rhizobium sp. RU35A]SIP92525.1 Uncharacterized conserved protein [Rhizobium sp. RU35A]
MSEIHTGGCQCGAIRFRMEGQPKDVSVCHCRMCQKAFGAYYAPLVNVGTAGVTWTRGEPKRFASSNFVQRGFCETCGTPLTYEAPDGLSLSAGSFDEPARLPPTIQFGIECRLPFVDGIPALPARATLDDLDDAPFLPDIVSRQHPDHDTAEWPPERPA